MTAEGLAQNQKLPAPPGLSCADASNSYNNQTPGQAYARAAGGVWSIKFPQQLLNETTSAAAAAGVSSCSSKQAVLNGHQHAAGAGSMN